ncbi:hypothetical protein N7532_010001 [Penicillium argentinense]|uniref:NAD(P)-binding domain-containing protein n=1 Tax=Penicillium argentinense TaxID=1131581 RepID=A0A9W9JXL7_9EURO|nr:uncharacterized protein N7532_010001 [Penicillium argentinense]KAJ5085230.1 hypothetical protein N7532_010001 [Penicillium argentinense]
MLTTPAACYSTTRKHNENLPVKPVQRDTLAATPWQRYSHDTRSSQYSVLVRSTEKAEQVKAQYPNIRIVLGDLDDSPLLQQESAAADIVLHAADASDRVGAAKAIIAGLVAGHSEEKPGYDKNEFGNKSDHVYNNWDKVDELLNLPNHAFHCNVDQLVLGAGAKHSSVLKTALVCPPTNYATSTHSSRTPQSQAATTQDSGAQMPTTLPRMANVWGELSKSTAEAAAKLGCIPEARTEQIDLDTAKAYAGFEGLRWGTNSRGHDLRAREVLGWNPSRPSLFEEIPETVRSEWERLQK